MHSLLFLGDSYTIGEGLPLADSYPYQTVQLLRRAGHGFYAPEIIARTGWTTDELAAAIDKTRLLPSYSFVTLLIGVNNQYRDRDAGEYQTQFEQLLAHALALTGDPGRIFVLSIPDWGVSPYAVASGRDTARIGREIDAFNTRAAAVTRRYGPAFIDITSHGRVSGGDPANFTSDGLHPAAAICHYWATELSAAIMERL